MPSLNAQTLTQTIRRLVATDTYARPPAGSLTSNDVELLAVAARGDRDFELPLSPQRAISALAAAANAEVAIPVLEQVARNPDARRTNRIFALRGLGRIATPEAQDLLLEHTHDVDPRLQQAAFAALGLFADRSALDSLNLSEPGDRAAHRQLSLTRALIAHRNGLEGPFLPEIQGSRRELGMPERMITFTLAMKTADATAADQARLRGSTYGIRLADTAYALRCGRAEWTMFGNRDLGRSITANNRLFERPFIAALLARWLPPGIAAATQYLVLSRPARRSVRLDVVRADGEIIYTGSAEAVGSALSFTIFDVDRPQTAPTKLAGLLGFDSVRLDVASMFDNRVATRQTEPVRAGLLAK
jgi:hypothetical protein